jgi:hypothetical protein
MNRWVPALVASLPVPTFVAFWSGLLLLLAETTHLGAIAVLHRRS